MSKKYQPLLITHYMSTWVTITEAVGDHYQSHKTKNYS